MANPVSINTKIMIIILSKKKNTNLYLALMHLTDKVELLTFCQRKHCKTLFNTLKLNH